MKIVEEDPEGHPEYTIRDGRLYRDILHTLYFNDTDPGNQWKICIPRGEQANILREAHDEPSAGHLGLAKTLVRLARQYYWTGMLRMAAKYVRTCVSCQKKQSAATSHCRKNARNPRRSAMANDFDRFNRATTKIHRWTHLATRNARPFHQVGRITPVEKGHRKSGHTSRHNPDLPSERIPRCHRDR